MARHVMVSPQFEVNSVDLSSYVQRVTIEETASDVTSFASGDGYTVYHEGGAKTGMVDVELIQDYDAAKVYATLRPQLGKVISVKVKPKSGAAAADNPEFDMNCFIRNVPSITGTVGELSTVSVSWPISGAPTITT